MDLTKVKVNQKPNLVAPVHVIPGLFSAKECREIVNTALRAEKAGELEEIRHEWKLPKAWQWDKNAPELAAACYKTDLLPFDTFYKLKQDLLTVMLKVNKDVFKFELANKLSQCDHIMYYKKGDFSSWHTDGYWEKNQESKTKGFCRKLTMIVQLTNENSYEGCDLKLFAYNHPKQNIRKVGTAILFPSFAFHEVAPLCIGVRHALAAFVDGPFFR